MSLSDLFLTSLKTYHKSETHVKEFPIAVVIAQDGDEIGLDDPDLSEGPPESVIVVVASDISDQVFDALQAVVVLVVLGAVVRAQRRTGRLQFGLPLHRRMIKES